jgi:protein TonB
MAMDDFSLSPFRLLVQAAGKAAMASLRAGPDGAASALRPVWLRPAALLLILVLHAAVFRAAPGPSSRLLPLDAVEVALEPLGNAPEDQRAIAEVSPSESPAASAVARPPEEKPTELAAPPPQVEAPDAVPLPVDRSPPIVRPRPKPVEKARDDDEDEKPTARAQRREAREAAEERRRKAQDGRSAARRGVAQGAPAAGGLSHASYAALLAAEIRRRTFYPASARAAGASGDVGVAFTVGASGRIIGQSITVSSGSAALDGAARAILQSVRTPPPPDGRFSATTRIRFHLD